MNQGEVDRRTKEIYRNGNSIDAWVQVEWSRGERKKEGKIQEVDRHMGKLSCGRAARYTGTKRE
jgi:hypothetical protein